MKQPAKSLKEKTPFSIRLDKAARDALAKAAKREDRYSAYIAQRAVLEWLKTNGFLK